MDILSPIMETPPSRDASRVLVLYHPFAPVIVLSCCVITTLPDASARPVLPS